jgi:hypothetical protein
LLGCLFAHVGRNDALAAFVTIRLARCARSLTDHSP